MTDADAVTMARAQRDEWIQRAHQAEAERDVLRGEVVALREVLEKIALREPYQHCHDCNVTHAETNRALTATPHAATLAALVAAALEERQEEVRADALGWDWTHKPVSRDEWHRIGNQLTESKASARNKHLATATAADAVLASEKGGV